MSAVRYGACDTLVVAPPTDGNVWWWSVTMYLSVISYGCEQRERNDMMKLLLSQMGEKIDYTATKKVRSQTDQV